MDRQSQERNLQQLLSFISSGVNAGGQLASGFINASRKRLYPQAQNVQASNAPSPTPTPLDQLPDEQLVQKVRSKEITADQANAILKQRATIKSGGNYSPQAVQSAQQMLNFVSASGKPYQVPANPQYDQADVRKLVEQHFPSGQVDNALKVIQGESGGQWYKIGDDYPIAGETIPSYGLFQIRGFPGRPNKETLLNPEENVKYAAELYKRKGWKPWTVAQELGLK